MPLRLYGKLEGVFIYQIISACAVEPATNARIGRSHKAMPLLVTQRMVLSAQRQKIVPGVATPGSFGRHVMSVDRGNPTRHARQFANGFEETRIANPGDLLHPITLGQIVAFCDNSNLRVSQVGEFKVRPRAIFQILGSHAPPLRSQLSDYDVTS